MTKKIIVQVDFSLTVRDALISGRRVDYLQLRWREELTPVELAGRYNRWLYDDDFVGRQLPDIIGASQLLLSISPL